MGDNNVTISVSRDRAKSKIFIDPSAASYTVQENSNVMNGDVDLYGSLPHVIIMVADLFRPFVCICIAQFGHEEVYGKEMNFCRL